MSSTNAGATSAAKKRKIDNNGTDNEQDGGKKPRVIETDDGYPETNIEVLVMRDEHDEDNNKTFILPRSRLEHESGFFRSHFKKNFKRQHPVPVYLHGFEAFEIFAYWIRNDRIPGDDLLEHEKPSGLASSTTYESSDNDMSSAASQSSGAAIDQSPTSSQIAAGPTYVLPAWKSDVRPLIDAWLLCDMLLAPSAQNCVMQCITAAFRLASDYHSGSDPGSLFDEDHIMVFLSHTRSEAHRLAAEMALLCFARGSKWARDFPSARLDGGLMDRIVSGLQMRLVSADKLLSDIALTTNLHYPYDDTAKCYQEMDSEEFALVEDQDWPPTVATSLRIKEE